MHLPHFEKIERLISYFQDVWRKHPFRLALCVSLLIHAIFLSFRWGMDEIQNRRLNTPLSVVLVNASNKTPPKQANKLAQADLQGGGKSDTQDASALHRARLGAEARLEVLEKQQKQMLAKLDEQRTRSGGRKSGEEQKIALQRPLPLPIILMLCAKRLRPMAVHFSRVRMDGLYMGAW